MSSAGNDDYGPLEAVLHEVAQPLTALCGLLDEASRASDVAAAMMTIQCARTECHRAISVVHRFQAGAARGEAGLLDGRA